MSNPNSAIDLEEWVPNEMQMMINKNFKRKINIKK